MQITGAARGVRMGVTKSRATSRVIRPRFEGSSAEAETSVIWITQSVSFRRHNSTSVPGVGMKQAREFRAALCVFMNLKTRAIWKAEENDSRGRWYVQ
jgi:hypothetical protein